MESNELKFLLTLLGCSDENYRTLLSASSFKSFKGKDKLCRDLCDRGLVDFSREVATVKILPPGRAILNIPTDQLPITNQELKVLEKIAKASGKTKSSEITSVKATEREAILKSLSERGLIETETKIKRLKPEVWLTLRGQEYLRDNYASKGNKPVISLDLLTNYLRFLRKALRVQSDVVSTQTPESRTAKPMSKPSNEEILQTIRDLDKELGTKNYLPIFQLRQKLQPPLSREELDHALYSLQRNNQIELSSLADPTPYIPEQIDAGIPKDVGGSLFFIMVS